MYVHKIAIDLNAASRYSTTEKQAFLVYWVL